MRRKNYLLIGILIVLILILTLFMPSNSQTNFLTGNAIFNYNPSMSGQVVYSNPEKKMIEPEIVPEIPKRKIISNTSEYYWDHMPLTYNYFNCSQNYVDKIEKATEFISNRTNNSIQFQYLSIENPDISFICANKRDMSYTQKYIENTLAQATPYIYEDTNNYAPSQIHIYSVYTCPYSRPVTEIHEILHLLGLEHPLYAYENDIMNPKHVGCNSDITQKDLEFLIDIYG